MALTFRNSPSTSICSDLQQTGSGVLYITRRVFWWGRGNDFAGWGVYFLECFAFPENLENPKIPEKLEIPEKPQKTNPQSRQCARQKTASQTHYFFGFFHFSPNYLFGFFRFWPDYLFGFFSKCVTLCSE